MTHMNLDYDGAANAYGPESLEPLDTIRNARNHKGHYVGVMSVKPTEHNPVDANGMIKVPGGKRVKVDPDQPDTCGCLPVIQQAGKFAGYYVSTTSKKSRARDADPSVYEQSHYIDSASVAYCALSGGLHRAGVGGGDFGFAIRLDSFRTASFNFLDGEGAKRSYAVGECSYRVFLDIGGKPKKTHSLAKNDFPTCFVVFPGSKSFPLTQLGSADNPGDFAAFIALQGQEDAVARGRSGLTKFNEWAADGRAKKPARYDEIRAALAKYMPLA